jgi:exopolysaccharide biosynthesis polyprenyl glycosylphosphotransferase
VFADLAAFGVMREFMRSVRDFGVFGPTFVSLAERLTPRGVLSGWQYAFALLVGLFATGNYGRGDMRRDSRRILAACAVATALPFWMVMWTHGAATVILQYLVTTGMVWIGILIERRTLDRVVAWIAPPERHAPRTLFVGTAGDCREVMELPAFKSAADFRVLGFVEASIAPSPGALGALPDLARCLHEAGADTVVVCGYLSDMRFQDVVDTALASGCQLLSVPRSTLLAGVQPNLLFRKGQPLIELTAPSLKAWQLVLKRGMDLLGATVMLMVASPFMAVMAIVIKLDSPGPVLFGQQRFGTGGRRFRVLKFRTMKQGASDAVHRELVQRMIAGDEETTSHTGTDGKKVYKLVKDDRVTKFGAFLRRTSLDELPQLFNVLRGDMSLVGPRPPLDYEIEAYDHWQYDRLQVLPGITGLWQVSGRNLLTYRQMCELDVEYVRNWSLIWDFFILLKTVPVVLFNRGRAA